MFYRDPQPSAEDLAQHVTAEITPVIDELLQVLEQGDWSKESISAGFKQVLKTHGIKMPQLAMPVRVLAVGTAHTPSVDAVLALLGREKITERLQKR
ncbi:Glutamate--tRNA ligase [compost metagenome]